MAKRVYYYGTVDAVSERSVQIMHWHFGLHPPFDHL
jgi:hypothetical protein